MIVEVAAGVIDGNIETDCVCMSPDSASRRITGSRPVWTAGQTTCGVAASITTSRTLDATASVYTSVAPLKVVAPNAYRGSCLKYFTAERRSERRDTDVGQWAVNGVRGCPGVVHCTIQQTDLCVHSVLRGEVSGQLPV